MKLIVGLGNPGKKYEKTRHNIGFAVVEKLSEEWDVGSGSGCEGGKWVVDERFKAEHCQSKRGVILAKPMTMMNASGYAIKKLLSYLAIELLSDLWVVHDDLDLPLGKIKIRKGGGTAGHRGVQSVIDQLETDQFVRFRLGIGYPGPGSSDKEVERYVLAPFGRGEKNEARRMVKRTVKAIEFALEKGIEAAMARKF